MLLDHAAVRRWTRVSGLLCDRRLILAILWCLPLADAANVDVLGLHRDQRDPAQLEPGTALARHHLGIVASRADVRLPVTLLRDLGRASEDDGKTCGAKSVG